MQACSWQYYQHHASFFSKSLSLAGKVHFTDRIRFYDMTKFLQTDDLNQIESHKIATSNPSKNAS